MKKHRVILVFFMLFLETYHISAQENQAYLKLDTCWTKQLERVYLHVPLKSIVAGNYLPFKAYIIQSKNSQAADVSAVIYFDIINQNGKILTSWKSEVLNKTAFGKAIIPDTISSGVYTLRSYTKWMLNAGTEYIFQTPLLITNLKSKKSIELTRTISQLENTASTNSFTNSKNINIQTTSEGDDLALTISNKTSYDNIYLSVIFQGEIILEKSLIPQTNKINFSLPSGSNGLAYAIITNKENRILFEVAIPSSNSINSKLKIELLNEHYSPGQEIQLQLSPNTFNENEIASFSCAITRLYNYNFSPLYPSLKEYISVYSEIPNKAWPNRKKSSDRLTKENSQINWSNSVWNSPHHKENKKYKCIKELGASSLSGQITLKKTGLPIAGASLSLSVNDAVPQVIYSRTTDNGYFYFWLDKSFNNKELLLQIINDTINFGQVKWEIDKNYPKTSNYTEENISLSPSDKKNITEINQLALINGFYNKSLDNSNSTTKLNTSFIQYPPDYVRFPSEFSELNNFVDIANNILPLVDIKTKDDNWEIEIYNPDARIILSKPLILMNGVLFSDLDFLVKLPAEEINKIGVYHSKIYYGEHTFQGIIDIQTKQGILPEKYMRDCVIALQNKVLPTDNEIIYKVQPENRNKPNLERILYWNPQLTLAKNTKFPIKITAPDFKGAYKINIEGITNTGIPISITKHFSIN